MLCLNINTSNSYKFESNVQGSLHIIQILGFDNHKIVLNLGMSSICNFLKSTYKLFQYLNESNSLQIAIKLRESERHYHFIELLKQIQETFKIIDDTIIFTFVLMAV